MIHHGTLPTKHSINRSNGQLINVVKTMVGLQGVVLHGHQFQVEMLGRVLKPAIGITGDMMRWQIESQVIGLTDIGILGWNGHEEGPAGTKGFHHGIQEGPDFYDMFQDLKSTNHFVAFGMSFGVFLYGLNPYINPVRCSHSPCFLAKIESGIR